MDVLGEVTSEIGAGNGERPELVHASKYNIRTGSLDLDIGDGEIGEVLKAREPDARDLVEALDACEGAKRGDKFRRETNGSDGAVEELKRLKSGEGFEGGVGQSNVGGAVRETERDDVAEGFGGVAESGIVGARVLGGRDVEGLECSELLRVERGRGRRRRRRRRRRGRR